MSFVRKVSMRLVAMFLPKMEAGACIPSERCYCRYNPSTDRFHWVLSNCLGQCTIYGERCP